MQTSTSTKVVLGAAACSCSAAWLSQTFVGSNPSRPETTQDIISLRGAAVGDAESELILQQAGQSEAPLPGSGHSLAAAGIASAGALALLASRNRTTTSRPIAAVARTAYNASQEIGACDPLLFWDPANLCQGDCTKADFDRRRAVELKHGRLCMLATIGMVWPDIFGKFDGDLSPSLGLKFSDIPSGIAAIPAVPIAGWVQILFFAGLIETQLFKDPALGGFGVASTGAEPGNFGTGYWGRKIQDAGERRLKLTTELNNGRLAMVSFTAMAVQNYLTGQSPIEQLTSGHISPFNDGQGFFAFDPSKELGACEPLGYWDPFGMMAFQDEEKFRRNRELELKHGRICMVATIGVLTPDLIGRFPGYLSPSGGLKFSDVPSSIQAVYKVPFEGWLQIFAFAGAIEAKNLYFPTDYGYPPFLGSVGTLTVEEKQDKLLAEINNGRLAMMAMAGIVAQNGVTGLSLVEQFEQAKLNPWIGGYAKAEGSSSRTALRATSKKSAALPWLPVPTNLTNDPLNGEYAGDHGFDPAGFAQNKRLLPWYREAELAHGRVCMMAILGINVQAFTKIEPFISRYPTSSEDPLLAATQVPIVGWLQILAVIALSELWRYQNVIRKYDDGVEPGDLGWNPKAPMQSTRPKWFGPTFEAAYTPEEFKLMRLREIRHCRLAMVGFFFIILSNAANGVAPTLIPDFSGPEYYQTVGDFIPKNI